MSTYATSTTGLKLVHCSMMFVFLVVLQLIAAAKAAVPTISDQAVAVQLGTFAKLAAKALGDLRPLVTQGLKANRPNFEQANVR